MVPIPTRRHILIGAAVLATIVLIAGTASLLKTRTHIFSDIGATRTGTGARFSNMPQPAGNFFAPSITNRDSKLNFPDDRFAWDNAKVYGFFILPFNPPAFVALPYSPPAHLSSFIMMNLEGEEPLHKLFLYEMAMHADIPCQVLDVGANYGVWTLIAGNLGCKVVAVEAADNIAATLALSVRMNNLEQNVRVVRKAIMSRKEMLSGSKDSDFLDGGMAHVMRGDKPSASSTPSATGTGSAPSPVPLKGQVSQSDPLWSTLATDLVEMEPLRVTAETPLLLLKIDVEGCDLEALMSAMPLFEEGLVLNVLSEMGPPDWWTRCSGPANKIDPVKLYTQILNTGKYQLRLISPSTIAVREWSNPGGGLPPGRGVGRKKMLTDTQINGVKGDVPDPLAQGDIPEYSVVNANDLPMFMQKYYDHPYLDAGGAQAEVDLD